MYTGQHPTEKVSTEKFVRTNSLCLVQKSQIPLLRRHNDTVPKRNGDKTSQYYKV